MVALHSTSLASSPLRLRRLGHQPRRVAVVLNVNARRVDAETQRWIQSVVPRQDLFLSRSLEDGKRGLPRISIEGRPSMFCGFGLDAQILDDFGATVGALRRAGIADHVKSAGVRYFLSVTSRSLPRFLFSSRPEVVAINRGAPAI